MKENISTTPEVISVELRAEDGVDMLHFAISDEVYTDGISVNLNSDEGRQDLANLFSILLKRMLNNKITLSLGVQEGYDKGLYKDVATEYINALNQEIDKVYENMKTELL